MNSFRFLQRGVEAEIDRQEELIGAGGTVEQETLHFDPASGDLTSLRSKEEAHDYRYFPEPDLVAIVPTEAMLTEARESLPELPEARIARYESELGLDEAQARLLAGDPEQAEYFEAVLDLVADRRPKVVANWVTGELTAALRQTEEGERPDARTLADLVDAVQAKRVSHAGGKQVLAVVVSDEEADVDAIIEREGLAQMGGDDGELAGDRRRRDRRRSGRRRADPLRQRQGDRGDSRRCDAGDEGPRRRRRGQPPDPRAARPLSRAFRAAHL